MIEQNNNISGKLYSHFISLKIRGQQSAYLHVHWGKPFYLFLILNFEQKVSMLLAWYLVVFKKYYILNLLTQLSFFIAVIGQGKGTVLDVIRGVNVPLINQKIIHFLALEEKVKKGEAKREEVFCAKLTLEDNILL